MAKVRTPAVAYLRTSSAANVGSDKVSEHRQRAAVRAFAKRAGFEVADTDWFYDAAVSGRGSFPGLRPASSARHRPAIVQSYNIKRLSSCVLVQNWGYGVSRVRSPLFGDDSQRLGPIKQFGVWQALQAGALRAPGNDLDERRWSVSFVPPATNSRVVVRGTTFTTMTKQK